MFVAFQGSGFDHHYNVINLGIYLLLPAMLEKQNV